MSDHEHSLFHKLNSYAQSDYYPFHMPGHKRQQFLLPSFDADHRHFSPEQIDITEISGFDDLHHPIGILKEAQERTAKVFGAHKSYYLVNGSTAGILAAVFACTKKGDHILMARNCHKSVYHAAFLNELSIEYIHPAVTDPGIAEGISPEAVSQKLSQIPQVSAIVITSPTYDGIVSDIRAIADIAHAHRIPLIVDEAHGAHFGFSDAFPKKALAYGADIVIESLHKTLPAFTQSAVLHLADSPYVDESVIKYYLSVFQTSSPSYLLMAGIDRCTQILQTDGQRLFSDFKKKLAAFYEKAAQLKHISVLYAKEHLEALQANTCTQKDPSKIIISADAADLSGGALFTLLRDQYHLEMEMASLHYVTALTTIMDTDEGFQRLIRALEEIDRMAPAAVSDSSDSGFSEHTPVTSVADNYQIGSRPLSESVGSVCDEFIIPYPPGIPILVPGEIIQEDHIKTILSYLGQNIPVYGIE